MHISTIVLMVADLERAAAFYEKTLGFSPTGRGGGWAFFDGGGVMLALRAAGAGTPDAPGSEVVIEVDDIALAHQALAGKGVPFRVAPRAVTSAEGRDLLAADFIDPDGNVLSITGWVVSPGGHAA